MQSFDSAGVPIAFVDEVPAGAGATTPIVLVHGFASTHAVNWINPGWLKTLTDAGRRVVMLDNRGHGQSGKPHDPEAYGTPTMAEDVRRLLDHLGIVRADVMGYSMGARITAFLALAHPDRVRAIVLGGLGHHLVEGVGLPARTAEAMEAPSLEALSDPTQRMFRRFAEANRQDLVAMAACIRGSRQTLTPDALAGLTCPALVAVGTDDHIAGDPHALADLMPNGKALPIPKRDHNFAVGDKVYKAGVLQFLSERDEETGANT